MVLVLPHPWAWCDRFVLRRWRDRLCRFTSLFVTPSADILPAWVDRAKVLEVEWGAAAPRSGGSGGSDKREAVYPVDVAVEAADRQGLLRDISEVFAKDRLNVIGVQTQSVKGTAWMTFTVEIADSQRLGKVLGLVREVGGVRSARRR